MTETVQPLSLGRRIDDLADQHPDKTAIIFFPEKGGEQPISWLELSRTTNRIARLFAGLGVTSESMVIIGLPNCPEHLFSAIAAWKLGACALPLSSRLPRREQQRFIDLVHPGLIVSDWEGSGRPSVNSGELAESQRLSHESLPAQIAHPGKAIASGGSTGLPKVIVDPNPWGWSPDSLAIIGSSVGFRSGQTQLVAGALYHNSPFCWTHWGLMEDQEIILMERFGAARALDLIERCRVNYAFMVPTMMSRILKVPGVHDRDLTCLEGIFHTAAPCPEWLKRAWIDLIGAEQVYEAFGSAEMVGYTTIRGDEWLEHAGSVGKPEVCDVLILDEQQDPVPTGEVGEIFMRLRDSRDPTYYYLGADPAKTTNGGFVSVGDMGWMDQEGYLFLADRRTDLIITGGANVYPAEVEAALSEHAQVQDVAVVGMPDQEWGKRVHAVIQPIDFENPPSVAELDRHCRERLTSYKIPKSYKFTHQLPRNAAGKIRRSALAVQPSPDPTTTPVREASPQES
jgi:bile acid-coenzyme A ligase